MLEDRAVLTLPSGNIGAPGDPVTGKFVFAGNLEVTHNIRTGYIIGGAGAGINNIIQQFTGDESAPKGQGFFLDLGSGAHVVEVAFRGWEGARIPTGYDSQTGEPTGYEYLQWGNTGDETGKTYGDATAASPTSQIDVLIQYLRHIKIDSASPATLAHGEYSQSGMYEPIDVAIEGPTMTRAAQDGSWFDGQMSFVEAAAIEDVYSAEQQGKR